MLTTNHSQALGWPFPAKVAFTGIIAIALFFLWTEHRAHLFAYWPFLFVLACPLMHVFMHYGGGRESGSRILPTGRDSAMNDSAYGLWPLVILNTLVFLIFAFSFSKPRTGRDWRSFGAFSAFIVALFTEMYGFPLTIYLIYLMTGSKYPMMPMPSPGATHP